MEAQEIIDVVAELDRLASLPRTGWLFRGIRPAESVAEHSYAVALTSMLLADVLVGKGYQLDVERVLKMALLHDAAEARTGDLPMPVKTPQVRDALKALDASLVEQMLPPPYVALHHECEDGQSVEARLVKVADKLQMMVKATIYESQGWTGLAEFWDNPANFPDGGFAEVRAIQQALAKRASREIPLVSAGPEV